MNIHNKLKNQRLSVGLTLLDVAKKVGVSEATVSRWESGNIANMKRDKIVLLAQALKVSPSFIMEWDDVNDNKSKGIKIPVLGTVAAGIPIEAIEDILDYEEISEDMARQGTFFGLKIKGDSMSPAMLEGDIVIVKQQSTAESGDIVIAKVNGDEACCKKLLKQDDGISLISFNPTYEPMYFNKNDIENKPVSIIGKVAELRRKL